MEDGFVVTKEYRRFAEFCDACRRDRYIGLCYGQPGVGKTVSARQYTSWTMVEPMLRDRLSDAESDAIDPDAVIGTTRAVLYTPTVTVSPGQLDRDLGYLAGQFELAAYDVLFGWLYEEDDMRSSPVRTRQARICAPRLLVVDEADRLKMAGLEVVRDFYDRDGPAVVLVGMPGLERRLSRYPQLYSRVGFVHEFKPLAAEELAFLVRRRFLALGLGFSDDDFADAEAMAAIVRITAGNFRLLDRLLSQVARLVTLNRLHVVTEDVVNTARSMLVVGT